MTPPIRTLTRPSTISAVGFFGSAIATAIGWTIARRAELQHAALELERERRQAARDEKLADVLLELRIRQAAAETSVQSPDQSR